MGAVRSLTPDPAERDAYPIAPAGPGPRIRVIQRDRVKTSGLRGWTSHVGRIRQDRLTVSVRAETFPERLARLREAAGLKQHGLKRLSGVPQATIAMIESGKRTDVAAGTLLGLSRALGVSMGFLFSGKQECSCDPS